MKLQTPTKDEIRKFVLFVLVGSISATVTIIVRAFLSHTIEFELAVLISQFVGLTIAFTLGRAIVFTGFVGSVINAYGRFFVVNLLSLTIVTGVSAILYRSVLPLIGWTFYPDYTAHITGLGAATFPSYFGHRYFSFRMTLRT